jgi:hypothetical protein
MAAKVGLTSDLASLTLLQERFMHGFQFTPQQLTMLKDYSKTGFQPKMFAIQWHSSDL